jgi:hypothetical protein
MDAVGRIIITRNGEDIFEVGAWEKKVQGEELVVDSGGGKILGAWVHAGQWVESLTFQMLKSPIESKVLTNFKLTDDLEKKSKEGIDTNFFLGEAWFKNSNPVGGANQTYVFTNVHSETREESVETKTEHNLGGSVQVNMGGEIGLPVVAEGKLEVQFKIEYKRVWSTANKYTFQEKVDLSVTQGSGALNNMLQPQTAVLCTSWGIKGEYNGGYTADIECLLQDGSKYTYKDEGNVHSVNYMRTVSECKEHPIKDAPVGAKEAVDSFGTKRDIKETTSVRDIKKTNSVRGIGWFRF